MDFLYLTSPISGVETWAFNPPLVAFIVSFFTSMSGVSGAFVLLPYQMSVLNYTAPSVSGTNQLFNIVAIPMGVWRYVKEKRMVWPLTWAVIIGTLPGVLIGAWVRLEYLPDPENFKFFAGLVLVYIGIKLLTDTLKKDEKGPGRLKKGGEQNTDFVVTESRFTLKRVEFKFSGQDYSFPVPAVFFLCLVVGIVGGIYGIGGGAIVAPDWHLGILFGIGGFCGMYLGARCQKYLPARAIKLILCFCVLAVAGKYIINFIA